MKTRAQQHTTSVLNLEFQPSVQQLKIKSVQQFYDFSNVTNVTKYRIIHRW
jgi:hypothetical protein